MARNLKIVIADDSPAFGHACAHLLRNYGFTVFLTPKDGIRLVREIIEYEPEIVLCDMVLPKLDALGVLAEIGKRDLTVNPAVILLASSDNPRLERAAFRAGAAYYLIKPVNAETLTERILLFSEELSGREPEQASPADPEGVPPAKPDLVPMISTVIRMLGVQAHRQGYAYLRDALVLTVENPNIIHSVKKAVCAGRRGAWDNPLQECSAP
jgi:two-component system response regulator (stage 0 sporulation protein A)